ncbi:MAG: Gmad2 immunoglobulin-like domain-containing protein [Patescibacteria group bacterium]
MSKKNFLFIICLIILAAALVLRITDKEDDWVCSGGEWVKHGQPSDPMPSEPCVSEFGELEIMDEIEDGSVDELENLAGGAEESEIGAPNIIGQPILGGDRDEHGCIGSAGYSWCEAKGKCLRIWEELCSPLEAIPDISAETEATLSVPLAGALVSSPLAVEGTAKGTWFFEANLPLWLVDENGLVIARVGASTAVDWMTEEMIPFRGILIFETPKVNSGYLIVAKDNPSGLPENDAFLKLPVRFR